MPDRGVHQRRQFLLAFAASARRRRLTLSRWPLAGLASASHDRRPVDGQID
jgi:hypothetical protein